jgi:CRP-like cAMP-binding protein
MGGDKSALAQERGAAPCRQCVLAALCPAVQAAGPSDGTAQRLASPRSYRRRALLQREGERSGLLRFVKSGLLGIRQIGLDGVERAIAIIGPGHLIGQPVMQGAGALVSAEALTSVSVCEFSTASLQSLQDAASPEVACMGRYLRQAIGSLAAWSHLMRMPSLDQRMAAALRLIASAQPPTATLLPSQAILAELLGVTRESVNRLWRDFEQRGLVRRGEGQLVELDLAALERLSTQSARTEY